MGNFSTESFDPNLVGVLVPPHTRRAGKYLLGPKLGISPVKSIVQCLARLENSDKYFQIKLLTLYSGIGRHAREESQDEKQGKVSKWRLVLTLCDLTEIYLHLIIKKIFQVLFSVKSKVFDFNAL